jgi:hypothetical protein
MKPGRLPRTYLIFGDIEGKLDVLRGERAPSATGRAAITSHKLIEEYGRKGNLMKWREWWRSSSDSS